MPNLSLRQRRLRVRGLGNRTVAAWANRKFLGLGNRATLTTALTGANNDMTFIAKTPGTAGNSVRVRVVVAGNNTPLGVTVAGNDITVNAATSGAAASLSTAADVVRAMNFTPAAQALCWAQLAPGNDGTGVVPALAFTSLAGAS